MSQSDLITFPRPNLKFRHLFLVFLERVSGEVTFHDWHELHSLMADIVDDGNMNHGSMLVFLLVWVGTRRLCFFFFRFVH